MARPPGEEQELERLAVLALRPRLGVRGSRPPGRLRRMLARGGGAGAGPAGRSRGGENAGGGDGAGPERGAASGYGYPPPASVGADAKHDDAAAETGEKEGAPLAFVNKGGLRTAAARPGEALNLILRLCPWRDHARDPGWGGGKRLCGGRGRVGVRTRSPAVPGPAPIPPCGCIAEGGTEGAGRGRARCASPSPVGRPRA